MAKKQQPYANRITGHGEEQLDAILYNPANWRVHPQSQQDALEGVLSSVGWVQDVIINTTTGHLVDGHLRCQVAARNGEKTIPVVYVELTGEEEALVLATIDPIAAMAATDKQKLDELTASIKSDDERVNALVNDIREREHIQTSPVGEDAGAQIDRAEELREKWGVELGQLWQLGEHRLICGDCTDPLIIARLMDGEKADLWMVDPPYGIDWKGSNASTLEWSEIQGDKDTEIAEKFFRALPQEQPAIVWGANCFPSLLPHRGRWLCWDKRVTEEADRMIGSPFELAWMNKTSGFDIIARVQHGGALNADGGDRYHPTQKPVALYEKAIQNAYKDTRLVYDPFSGSGTTLIACERLGRKCRAVEISPAYVAVAIQRWADLTGKQPELIG